MNGAANKPAPSWTNVIAALVCGAASSSFLWMALVLPAGHSRGDAGPGALPTAVGIFGVAISLAYLIQAVRGAEAAASVVSNWRAGAAVAIFGACLLGSSYIGLALAIGIASGLVTLLFPAARPIVRALATAISMWAIGALLFGHLLGLPLP